MKKAVTLAKKAGKAVAQPVKKAVKAAVAKAKAVAKKAKAAAKALKAKAKAAAAKAKKVACAAAAAVKANAAKALAVAHVALDIVGLIPGLGEIADGVNALIYLAQGDFANAALSAAAMIPFVGMAATGAKLVAKVVDHAPTILKGLSVAGDAMKGLGGLVASGVRKGIELAGNALKSSSNIIGVINQQIKSKSSYKYYMNLVDTLDVSTAKNTATFYSGAGNRQLAEEFAKINGKTTLEMTPGGKTLDELRLFGKESQLTQKQATRVWEKASKKYAEEASGNVYGFVKGAGEEGIFNTIEYPALQKNSNITNIFTELLN